MNDGPLDGTIVLDLSRALAGPIAGMILGDMGARVVKVEAPGRGDDSRSWGPPFIDGTEDSDSTYFMSANRNKESLEVDLKSRSGSELLRRLIQQADVLIENFRPGVLDRLGFSTEHMHDVNPRLVILSITGFGHDGPEGHRSGYDQIAQGEAGLMSLTGALAGEPTRIGVPISDVLAGVYGATGVTSALFARASTGEGMVVRTSLLAAAINAHTFHATKWTIAGEESAPSGNHHPQISPYGSFSCLDGLVQVAVGSESLWRSFSRLIGLDPQDSRFATNELRLQNRTGLNDLINSAFAGTSREDVLRHLQAGGVPAGAIRSIGEVYDREQTKSQGLLISVEHPVAGSAQLPGPAVRLEDVRGKSALRPKHISPASPRSAQRIYRQMAGLGRG